MPCPVRSRVKLRGRLPGSRSLPADPDSSPSGAPAALCDGADASGRARSGAEPPHEDQGEHGWVSFCFFLFFFTYCILFWQHPKTLGISSPIVIDSSATVRISTYQYVRACVCIVQYVRMYVCVFVMISAASGALGISKPRERTRCASMARVELQVCTASFF